MVQSNRSRTRRSPQAARLPRFPHPSWREAVMGQGQSGARIATASDFWERIGI